MATTLNADISETENFFSISYCASEVYIEFGVF